MTATVPTQLLRALAAARASMPELERNDSGYDRDDQIFTFPKEEDLREAVTMVFAEHGLMEVIGDAVASAGFLATTWSLHHVESGEFITHQITWPIDSDRRLPRPHLAAAAWSHAWRHFMTKLLAVRTVAVAANRDALLAARAANNARGTAEMDRDLGPEPRWAKGEEPELESPPAADVPWRSQHRLHQQRAEVAAQPPAPSVDTSPDAAWAAVGAVVEPPALVRSNFDVWAELCGDMRKAGCPKRWEFVIAAWHEFSGRTGDVLARESAEFQTWLKEQVAEWIRKNARPA